MVELKVYTKEGEEKGKVTGDEKVFSAQYKEALVHQALRCHRAALRRGTHSAKTRAEVRGGGRKPWKQKGTGRARAGTIRSPLWRGGGVIFGPKPRDYSFHFPRRMKKAAIRAVISDRQNAGRIKVIEDLTISKPKSKQMVKVLKGLDLYGKKTLILIAAPDCNLELAGRNIRKLKILQADALNIYDLLNCEWLVLQKAALPKISKELLI